MYTLNSSISFWVFARSSSLQTTYHIISFPFELQNSKIFKDQWGSYLRRTCLVKGSNCSIVYVLWRFSPKVSQIEFLLFLIQVSSSLMRFILYKLQMHYVRNSCSFNNSNTYETGIMWSWFIYNQFNSGNHLIRHFAIKLKWLKAYNMLFWGELYYWSGYWSAFITISLKLTSVLYLIIRFYEIIFNLQFTEKMLESFVVGLKHTVQKLVILLVILMLGC